MKGKLAVLLSAMLLLGCTYEDLQDGLNESAQTRPGCRTITYEGLECLDLNFNYSTGPLERTEPYKLDVFCVGGASVEVRNLERESGRFAVEFSFTTPIEGTVKKTVEQEIDPRKSAVFESKAQFRCSQDFKASIEVIPARKQSCRTVNYTREECVG
jgi:hypothetical protein